MKILFFIILITVSVRVFGSEKCSINGTKLIYVNGINTSEDKAVKAMTSLHRRLVYKNFDDHIKIPVPDMLHNFNESLAKDLMESIVQKIPDDFLSFMQVTDPFNVYRHFISDMGSAWVSPDKLHAIVDIVDLFSNYLQNLDKSEQYINDRNLLRAKYQTTLNEEVRILAISHSQGGLFMEDAFLDIATDKKHKYFVGFQIATPVLFTNISRYGYANHDRDWLMGILRLDFSNIEAPTGLLVDPRDWLDQFLLHGISTTYLYDRRLSDFVFEKLYEAAEQFESNCPVSMFEHEISSDGFTVNFDSTDPDRLDLTGVVYNWDFGDGRTETTESRYLNHKYEYPGKYNVVLTLTRKDGTEFWDKGIIKKEIEVGSLISGCHSSLGKYHINPDGTIGGFVANTATVSETSYLAPYISVCGNSQVLGASVITTSNVLPLNEMYVIESTLIDSTIKVGSYMDISESVLSNVKIIKPVDRFFIQLSSVSNSLFDVSESNSYFSIWNSSITNVMFSGHGFNVDEATIADMNFLNLDYPFSLYFEYIYYGEWSGTIQDWSTDY